VQLLVKVSSIGKELTCDQDLKDREIRDRLVRYRVCVSIHCVRDGM
jgi:hypothetical protein